MFAGNLRGEPNSCQFAPISLAIDAVRVQGLRSGSVCSLAKVHPSNSSLNSCADRRADPGSIWDRTGVGLGSNRCPSGAAPRSILGSSRGRLGVDAGNRSGVPPSHVLIRGSAVLEARASRRGAWPRRTRLGAVAAAQNAGRHLARGQGGAAGAAPRCFPGAAARRTPGLAVAPPVHPQALLALES